MKKIVLLTILMIFGSLFLMCGEEVSSPTDTSRGDGGGGGDGENADVPETKVTLRIETWTISSDGTTKDLPGAKAEVDGKTCTTPCDLELPTGDHNLYLTLSGWIQGPNPLTFHLTQDEASVKEIPTSIVQVSGLTLRHRLERDLTGSWVRQSDGTVVNVTMRPPRYPYMCPDSVIVTGPFYPLGALCVEGETLSVCKTQAPECNGLYATGRILEDGQRVEFCLRQPYDPVQHLCTIDNVEPTVYKKTQ